MMDPDRTERIPLRTLGRYQILGELGSGGMGVVLLGLDPALGREVAIKTLPPRFAGDPEAYERLRGEARLLAALNHPNIATIHSLEDAAGTPFLTMERIVGRTLREILSESGALPDSEAVRVAVSIARAVEAAHDRGVIHRDLKPGNVMLRDDGEVKVLDFGLAEEVEPPSSSILAASTVLEPPSSSIVAAPTVLEPPDLDGLADPDAPDQTQTLPPSHSGPSAPHDPPRPPSSDSGSAGSGSSGSKRRAAAGTPGYMSSEQILGQPLDERADIFAFGCVLYECCAGVPALEGKTPKERIASTFRPVPDLDRLPATCPAQIRAIIERCLAPLDARAGSMREVRRALEETLEQWTVQRLSDTARALSDAQAQGRAPASVPGNLPFAVNSFIGRRDEIESVRRRLGSHRLVTLTGAGGSGKTRLALEVARTAAFEHPDGTWVVELAPLKEAALLEKTIMTAAGIDEVPGRTARDLVLERFAEARALLILDNCEHLIGACADLAVALLGRTRSLRVLATSREALNVSGETRFVVPPLGAPPPEAKALTPAAALEIESVALFRERARQVDPDFEVDAENVDAIAKICQRLDGLPLAIELAASRTRALRPIDILSRLDDRFRILAGGAREKLPHHRTLWASIDWSYEQLEETERVMLRRLSVFAGGWTLEGAETICADHLLEEWQILDALTQLIDKSLVELDLSAAGRRVGSIARYRMLETVRQYSQAKLEEAGERHAIQTRLLEFYRGFTKRLALEMEGAGTTEWGFRTDAELGNLREAIRLGLAPEREASLVLETTAYLLRYWLRRSAFAEGRAFVAQALSRPGAEVPSEIRAGALNTAGALAYCAGDYAAAIPLLAEAIPILEHSSEPRKLGAALMNLGNVHAFRAEWDEALKHLERALAIGRRIGDRWLTAACLTNICNATEATHDLERLGSAAAEAVALFSEAGDQSGLLMAQNFFGAYHFRRGDWEEAIVHWNKNVAIAESLEDRYQLALTLLHRGLAEAQRGRLDAARSDYRTALETAHELGEPMLVLSTVEAFGRLARLEDDPARAATLFAAATAHRKRLEIPSRPHDVNEFREARSALREALGAEYAACEARGEALSLDDTVRLALSAPTARS